MSLRDSAKRPVFANDSTARSSIANRCTVPGSRGMDAGRVRQGLWLVAGELVSRHLGFDFRRPLVDPAHEVLHLAETDFPQEVRNPAGSDAGVAIHDDFIRGAELVRPARNLRDGHQDGLVESRDLPFHRLAHVEQDRLLPRVDLLFQLLDRDLEIFADLLRCGTESAELFVIDKLLDRWIGTANRAFGVLPQLELAELHPERVEHEEPADERVAPAEEELDRLDRLNRSDDAREDAEHAAFRARRHEARWRWRCVQTAITGASRGIEDAGLALEAEDRAVDVRFLEEDRRIVHEVSGREVVRPVDDHVIVFQAVECVIRRQPGLVRLHVDVRVDLRDSLFRDVDLLPPDVIRAVQHLALEVRLVDHVEVDEPETADAGGAQVLRERDSEPARANDQSGRLLEPQLPRHPDFGEDQVARVPLDFGRHQDVFALRSEPVHQGERTARDAWDNRNRVTGLQRRRILLQIADVFFVHVDVHEISELPVLCVQMTLELVELAYQVAERLFDAGRLDLDGIVIRGVLTEGCRDDDPDRWHRRIGFMSVLYLRFAPPLFISE